MTMCVLVPSRGRPSNIARLAEAWFATSAAASLIVAVDSDDPTLADYRIAAERYGFLLRVGEPSRIGPILNGLAPEYADYFDVVGFMGDDHLPRTEGWDTRLGAAAGEWGVAYGNDLLQGERLATAAFLGSGIVRTLGKFVPHGFEHLYLDNFWMGLGAGIGSLTYVGDVVIEHLHYINGKATEDDLYREVNAPGMYARDGQRWANYSQGGGLAADVAAVIAARDAS
jgi:hypothetical protein